MSTIKVDTLQTRAGSTAAVTGAGFVATDQIRGNTAANSVTVVGEGGTNTTNLQQGLVKHWCNLQADGFSINDSFNNASCTDNGTCDYDYTYTNAFANNDMCPSGFVRDGSATFLRAMQSIDGSNFSTTTINVTPVAVNASSLASNFDPNHCCISIVGDLA